MQAGRGRSFVEAQRKRKRRRKVREGRGEEWEEGQRKVS